MHIRVFDSVWVPSVLGDAGACIGQETGTFSIDPRVILDAARQPSMSSMHPCRLLRLITDNTQATLFPLGLTGIFDPIIGCEVNIVRLTPVEFIMFVPVVFTFEVTPLTHTQM